MPDINRVVKAVSYSGFIICDLYFISRILRVIVNQIRNPALPHNTLQQAEALSQARRTVQRPDQVHTIRICRGIIRLCLNLLNLRRNLLQHRLLSHTQRRGRNQLLQNRLHPVHIFHQIS